MLLLTSAGSSSQVFSASYRSLECETVTVCASRSVAGKRLVKTKIPSACATVNCNRCKGEIALYGLYLSVNTSECVTQLLISRTRLISGVHVKI
jgi:hypothetical protein